MDALYSVEHGWRVAWEAGALKRIATAISVTHILQISGFRFRESILLSLFLPYGQFTGPRHTRFDLHQAWITEAQPRHSGCPTLFYEECPFRLWEGQVPFWRSRACWREVLALSSADGTDGAD